MSLETYLTDDQQVAANTQQLVDVFAVKSIFDSKLKERKYQMGYQINSFVFIYIYYVI